MFYKVLHHYVGKMLELSKGQYMSKRNPTNKQNVYWRDCTTNGKKDKTYYITYRDENKKSREKKIGKASQGCTVQYAYQKYIETINQIQHGEADPYKRKKEKFTFNDAFNHYIDYAKHNKKTWQKDEELYLNHLKNFHFRELETLKQEDFNQLKIEKLKDYSESTVKYILAVARQIINYAINNELIKNYTNPIASGRVHMKQPQNAKLAFFTKNEAKKLLEEIKNNESKLLYDLTVLLLFTGGRFIEVASLTWNDINFETNLIYFKPTKEGNERYVPISPLVNEVLLSLDKNTFFVIPSSNNKQILQMPKQWQKAVDRLFPSNKMDDKTKKTADKLVIEKYKKYRLTPHSLRHTHASWMAMSNEFSLLEIQKRLGHKTLQMTQRYAHLMESDMHDKHNKIFNDF